MAAGCCAERVHPCWENVATFFEFGLKAQQLQAIVENTWTSVAKGLDKFAQFWCRLDTKVPVFFSQKQVHSIMDVLRSAYTRIYVFQTIVVERVPDSDRYEHVSEGHDQVF